MSRAGRGQREADGAGAASVPGGSCSGTGRRRLSSRTATQAAAAETTRAERAAPAMPQTAVARAGPTAKPRLRDCCHDGTGRAHRARRRRAHHQGLHRAAVQTHARTGDGQAPGDVPPRQAVVAEREQKGEAQCGDRAAGERGGSPAEGRGSAGSVTVVGCWRGQVPGAVAELTLNALVGGDRSIADGRIGGCRSSRAAAGDCSRVGCGRSPAAAVVFRASMCSPGHAGDQPVRARPPFHVCPSARAAPTIPVSPCRSGT